jgi:hypothetical protein
LLAVEIKAEDERKQNIRETIMQGFDGLTMA